MYDIFYFGPEPKLFPFERFADSLEVAAKLSRTEFFWFVYGGNDYSTFDFTWEPAPWEQDHIHVFPSQHQQDGGVYLAKKTFTEKTWHWRTEQSVKRLPDKSNWFAYNNIDPNSIDYSWHPNPHEPSFIYEFGTQWQSAGGARYTVPGATEIKFCSDFRATALPNKNNWVVQPLREDPDYSWHPNPFDPPYIYKFGTQWQRDNGATYTVPGATEIKYSSDFKITALPCSSKLYLHNDKTIEEVLEQRDLVTDTIKVFRTFWAVNPNMDYSEFDFSWHPAEDQKSLIHIFGSQWQKHSQTYYIELDNCNGKYNFVGDQIVIANNKSDIFFIDFMNKLSKARFDALKEKYPQIQKIRYVNSMLDTLKRCADKATTNMFWAISSENDYKDFNFDWHCEPWQNYMLHVFGNQWQKWSDTFLVNKFEFERRAKWFNKLEDFSDLNFVTDQKSFRPNTEYKMFYVDHGNKESKEQFDKLAIKYNVHQARFIDSYLGTFKRILEDEVTEYVWIVNSICDYSKFDFTWQPEPWQKEMLHVFPSNEQKFGDTFYVNVQNLREQISKLELLDWFDTINYCTDQSVPRFKIDSITTNNEDMTQVILDHTFTTNYMAINMDGVNYTPSIWRSNDRALHVFSKSKSVCLVPRDIKQYSITQGYDFPYILTHKEQFKQEKPLDIVFISNGEPKAAEMLNKLEKSANNRRIKKVSNIGSRIDAYQAAALASQTPWFFAVFAKLEVNENFDWDWQPDMLQRPKHYIFNATNPVNGLEYGHMGMIAYNKKLVMNTNNVTGLDFTLEVPHAVIPVNSGIARFNVDKWTTWRTTFREVIKLKYAYDNNNEDYETGYRLKVWTQGPAKGEFSEWVTIGVADALNYYDSVKGDLVQLRTTFEWQWLRTLFSDLHGKN